LDRAKILTADP